MTYGHIYSSSMSASSHYPHQVWGLGFSGGKQTVKQTTKVLILLFSLVGKHAHQIDQIVDTVADTVAVSFFNLSQ